MRKSTDIDLELTELQRKLSANERAIQRVNSEEHEALEPIYDQLEKIKKPFEKQREKLHDIRGVIRAHRDRLSEELKQAEQLEAWKEQEEQDDLTEKGVRSILGQIGVKDLSGLERKMKPLKNGLHIWKTFDEYEGRRYFVFHKRPQGWALVGYWTKAEDENPGDGNEPYSWLGVETMTSDNTMEALEHARVVKVTKQAGVEDFGTYGWRSNDDYYKENRYARDTSRHYDAGYRPGSGGARFTVNALLFIKDLKAVVDASKLQPFDLSDERNIRRLNSYYGG